MKLLCPAAAKTIALPPFPEQEAPLVRRLDARRTQDARSRHACDAVARRLDQDTVTVAWRADNALEVLGLGGANQFLLPLDAEADDASLMTLRGDDDANASAPEPAPAPSCAAGQHAVWQTGEGRLRLAWSCDTRVYERDDQTLFAKSTLVGRSEAEFNRFAVRPNALRLGRPVLQQRLFARGAYVAADVRTLGDAAQQARYLAHLNCLLGPVGDQLSRDYAALPTPWQAGARAVAWPLAIVTVALGYGAIYANALAAGEIKAPEAESRAFHVLHNVLLGCCVGYGMLGLWAASIAAWQRPEHRHVAAFRAVRSSHERLLQSQDPAADTVRSELQRSRDVVLASKRGWGLGRKLAELHDDDGTRLSARTLGELACEELEAYWAGAAGAADDGEV